NRRVVKKLDYVIRPESIVLTSQETNDKATAVLKKRFPLFKKFLRLKKKVGVSYQTQSRLKKSLVIGGISIILLAIFIFIVSPPVDKNKRPPEPLPASILNQINGFKVYYFKPGFSTDFALQHNSINYQDGVLIFSMKDPVGKTLAFTEESTPPDFDTS